MRGHVSVRIEHLNFGYARDQPILHNLTLTIEDAQTVLILGPNGAGKSTLLKQLNGILKPDSGSVVVNGLDTKATSVPELASHIAVTFQDPADQIFASTVQKEVEFGARILGRTNSAELARHSLELFGLTEHASRHPYDLSSAHRKLLTIASAVATDATILAFDEPTTALSQPERLVLLGALNELKRQKRTILIVSHDVEYFVPVVSRLAILDQGEIKHIGEPDNLWRTPRLARSVGMKMPLTFRLRRLSLE